MAVAKKAPAKRAPAKKAPAKKAEPAIKEVVEEIAAEAQEVTFGVRDLCDLIQEETGQTTNPRELRGLLRKMAKDGRIDREIIPGNRQRYDWSGPNDPEVQAVLQAFAEGELEADKQEKLAELKARGEAKRAAKKAAKAAEEDEDIEED